MSKELKADFDYCRKVIKTNSTNFYRAFSKMDTEKANAVFAIYTFCRKIDDITDDAELTISEKKARLLMWENILKNRAAYTEIAGVQALDATISAYRIDVDLLQEQIVGQRMDLDFEQPSDMERFLEYCYFVAGNLGLILLPIISVQDQQVWRKACVELGIAMQITNILRDIGEDYQQYKRIYLPKSIMTRFGYSEAEIAAQEINGNFVALWEHLAEEADQRYAFFERERHNLEQTVEVSVLFAARSYNEILNSVRNNDYDCFTKRGYVSKLKAREIYRQLIG